MRTVHDSVSVRLYHLDDMAEGGSAATLFYGPMGEAIAVARAQPADVQDGLYIATDNDVVHFLDLIDE